MDKTDTIERAKRLRSEDSLEESQELLFELLSEYPDDPEVLFEVGGSFDVMGLEPESMPYYRQAIDSGLEGEALAECLICLGSSQRLVGRAAGCLEERRGLLGDVGEGRHHRLHRIHARRLHGLERRRPDAGLEDVVQQVDVVLGRQQLGRHVRDHASRNPDSRRYRRGPLLLLVGLQGQGWEDAERAWPVD